MLHLKKFIRAKKPAKTNLFLWFFSGRRVINLEVLLALQPAPPLVHRRQEELDAVVVNERVGGLAQEDATRRLAGNDGLESFLVIG